ncbi:MAG: hypothetical protein EPO65_10165 [Dehalococcoidia bacterium]|nr:MAG: hypothetical protein EPO65_10165 [Dehalococcoidia bacterium]
MAVNNRNGRRVAVLLATLAGLTLAGCSSSEPASKATATTAASQGVMTTVGVTLKEFSLTAVPASGPAGSVTFAVQNSGLIPHELLVVKSDLRPDQLPQVDQKRVDETKVQVLGEVAEFDAGKKQELTLTLQPGKYVLLCNVVSHYISGMYTAFEVTASK